MYVGPILRECPVEEEGGAKKKGKGGRGDDGEGKRCLR
jgi:hypothetical protein